MIFSSAIFVFVFLPAFLATYYAMPWRWKSHVLLAFSYVFYAWWRVEYLALIFGMSLVSYHAAHLSLTAATATRRVWAMRAGVSVDLLILGWFKYAIFVQANVNGILTFAGGEGYSTWDILLPIGISFHTFQSISYIVDIYRRDAPPAARLIDFLAFGALFPQLIAGPVLRYKDLAGQFRHRTHSLKLFTQGMYRFTQGLAMKVLIADSVAPLADRIFAYPTPGFVDSWLGALAYTVQLFFDFAGYSAMAIGLGLMIGFRFIENFDAPYISRSITEFWRRWHISLSTWLRDYLYIPLGGNRRGTRRTYINLILTMVLGGIWHGANWTFVLWGLWHGGLIAVERALGVRQGRGFWRYGLAWPMTMLLVIVGWVMFRAPDVGTAIEIYGGMIGLNGFAMSAEIAWQMRPSELVMLTLGGAICLMPLLRPAFPGPLRPGWQAGLMTVLLIAALTRLASQSYSPFLYFQF